MICLAKRLEVMQIIVFSEKQGFMTIMRYPEVDEIVMGSPQTDSAYMYIIHDTKS